MQTPYPAQTLSIEGADALAFAQAQFSSNVANLQVGHWQFSAWLDARGRTRAFFHLARCGEDELRLLLRGGAAAELAEGLNRFVFRSRLRILPHEPQTLTTGAPLPMHAVQLADGFWQLGCGDHAMQVGGPGEPDHDWRVRQIRRLWPWLPDDALDTWLPASLGLDALHATALDKGCYPGQEIVARLHYRGGNKRHLYRLRLSYPVPVGSVLRKGANDSLPLLDVIAIGQEAEALAVIGADAASELSQETTVEFEGRHLMVRVLGSPHA